MNYDCKMREFRK